MSSSEERVMHLKAEGSLQSTPNSVTAPYFLGVGSELPQVLQTLMDSFQHHISKNFLGAVLKALPAYPFLFSVTQNHHRSCKSSSQPNFPMLSSCTCQVKHLERRGREHKTPRNLARVSNKGISYPLLQSFLKDGLSAKGLIRVSHLLQ